jgi:hypothetical protein
MPVRFVITTLKPGVDPAEYEHWVRERDCGRASSLISLNFCLLYQNEKGLGSRSARRYRTNSC